MNGCTEEAHKTRFAGGARWMTNAMSNEQMNELGYRKGMNGGVDAGKGGEK